MPSNVGLGVELGRFPSLPARADGGVQRSKATTPSPGQAAVPEPIGLLASGDRSIAVIDLPCLFEASAYSG